MLEINYTNKALPFYLSFSVFLKTVVFLPFSSVKFALFQNLFFTNAGLKRDANLAPCILHPNLTVMQNIDFVARLFKAKNLTPVPIKYFNLTEVVDKKLGDVNDELKFLISLSPLFFKQSKIWSVFIEDDILCENSKQAISALIESKVQNSDSIIFYATSSGSSLNFTNEINFA